MHITRYIAMYSGTFAIRSSLNDVGIFRLHSSQLRPYFVIIINACVAMAMAAAAATARYVRAFVATMQCNIIAN